jgi:hypothetical protein
VLENLQREINSLLKRVAALERMEGGIMDYGVEVARGRISGQSEILKFGRNQDVDTAAAEDVWDGGGTWVPPTAARVHAVVSSSTADDGAPAGTGAQTVTVLGLDDSYLEISETVTLDGTTPVNTVNSYRMIYRMYVTVAGSGGVNAGNITATAATDATITAQISTGFNQTLMAIYQVPANKTAYVFHYYAAINKALTSGVGCDIGLQVKPFGEVYQYKHILGLQIGGASYLRHDFGIPLECTQKSILKVIASTTANNTDISAGFDLVLVNN